MSLHPELVVLGCREGCSDGWMITHLFSEVLELGADVLVRFAEDGVERLCDAFLCTGVLSCAICSNIHDSLLRIRFIVSFHQKLFILHDLSDFLHHRDGLIDVDWYTELGDVLSNGCFEHLPDAGSIIWISEVRHQRPWWVVDNFLVLFCLLLFLDLATSRLLLLFYHGRDLLATRGVNHHTLLVMLLLSIGTNDTILDQQSSITHLNLV